MTIRLGVGHIHFFSYWLTVKNIQKEIIWEGPVYAKEVVTGDDKRLDIESLPEELKAAVTSVPQYFSEWEPTWEEVQTGLLTDGNNINGGEEDRQSDSTSADL